MTLSDLEHYSLISSSIPDILRSSLDIPNISLNYYEVSSDSQEITENDTLKELVFQPTSYWLASSVACVTTGTEYHRVDLSVLTVSSSEGLTSARGLDSMPSGCESDDLYAEVPGPLSDSFAIRPVVTLSSNVTLTKTSDGIWSIN